MVRSSKQTRRRRRYLNETFCCRMMGELGALAQQLTAVSSDSQTFMLVCQTCERLVPSATYISLALTTTANPDSLRFFALSGSADAPHRPMGVLSLSRTAAGAAIRRRQTITSDDPAFSGAHQLDDWRGIRDACHTAICAPILMNGVALGSLNVTSTQPHAFSGLQQIFSALAAIIAPHLRLTCSEKALKAAEQLLQDALELECANTAAANQQLCSDQPATLQGLGPSLRADSTASSTLDSLDIRQQAAAATHDVSAPTTDAAPASACPAGVFTAAMHLGAAALAPLRTAISAHLRPAHRMAVAATGTTQRDAAQSSSAGSKPGGKGWRMTLRSRGEGYCIEDYDFSSDDDAADATWADAAPALSAPLARWRGPLEFADPVTEGRYLAWASASWQAPLDVAYGSLALGRLMMLAASPNRYLIGSSFFSDGWLVAVCQAALAVLLLLGCHLMVLRRTRYVRHRETLVAGARLLLSVMSAVAQPESAPRSLGAKLRAMAAPSILLLPFAAQVRFSRHLLLAVLQVVITCIATSATSGFTWRGVLPVEPMHLMASAVAPATGLYLLEQATRQTFMASPSQSPLRRD